MERTEMIKKAHAHKRLPKVTIASVAEASKHLSHQPERWRHVLSIGSPKSSHPFGLSALPEHVNILRLEFDDVDPGESDYSVYDLRHYRAASLEQVKEIVKWAQKVRGGDEVLIHCHAGISRSAAAACILLALKGGPGKEAEAHAEVLRVRDIAWPNNHILRLADGLLGSTLAEARELVFGRVYRNAGWL